MLKDGTGGVAALAAKLEELTERKQTEEAQQHLAAIVTSSHDAIIGKTLDGIVTSWNRGAEERYGYSAAEVVGRSISIIVPPGRADEVPQFLAKVGRGEAVIDYEAERITKDGRRVTVLLTISPIRDASGKVVGASTVAQDITERKKAEEKIRIFSSAVNNAYDCIVMTDVVGNVSYANESALKSFGYSLEEAIKLDVSQFAANPEDAGRIIEGIINTSEWSGEVLSIRKNKESFPTLLSSSLVKDDGPANWFPDRCHSDQWPGPFLEAET